MNKLTILILLVFVVSLAGCAQQPTAQQTQPVQQAQPPVQQTAPQPAAQNENIAISIKDFAFNPSNLTVSVGATVKWTNDDSAPHSITSENFKSGTLNNGDSYEFRFATPGIYDYSCSIHPSMKGTILVK